MALPKLFQRIFFHNNTTPALNEDNLNAMSKGLSDVDDRLIELAGTIMEDVPQIIEDMEILEPAIENIDANVERAETAADNAEAEALKSEGYAIGEQDGVEVGPDSEYYQNNAKYYAEIANPPIENTVGFTDIITISDAINKAAKDVRLKVEPVQDLHGYANPWVGGAGKNKLPLTLASLKANNPSDASKTWDGNKYTYSSVEFTPVLDSNGNLLYINVNTTENTHAAAYFFIYGSNAQSQPNIFKGMKLSGCPSGGSSSTYSIVWQSYETQIVYPQHLSGSDVGEGITISEDAYTRMYISIPANSVLNNVRFYPMIRLATVSDATYEPYTNICPLTGWDNAKVTRSGKNLLSYDLVSLKADNTYGTWNNSTYTMNDATFTLNADKTISVSKPSASTSANSIVLAQNVYIPTGTYKVNGNPSGGGTETRRITVRISDGTSERYVFENGSGAEFTLAEGEYLYEVNIRIGGSTTFTGTISPMIRPASFADEAYEPYQGKELTISLNGTRYGGTLDVTSGVLTLDKGYIEYDGSEDEVWRAESGSGYVEFYVLRNSLKKSLSYDGMIICNRLNTYSQQVALRNNYGISGYSDTSAYPNNNWLYVSIPSITTVNDFITWLASNPLQVVYELATPQTIQLTAEEVYLLYGYNTLFGDCGDISLTYDASGIIHIAEAKLDTETLKTIAAASSDFADFKARIAAL